VSEAFCLPADYRRDVPPHSESDFLYHYLKTVLQRRSRKDPQHHFAGAGYVHRTMVQICKIYTVNLSRAMHKSCFFLSNT
jgi:hypothetical protein